MFIYIYSTLDSTSKYICKIIATSTKNSMKTHFDSINGIIENLDRLEKKNYDLILAFGNKDSITENNIRKLNLKNLIDLVLYSPEAKYDFKKTEFLFKDLNIPIKAINMKAFGLMDGDKILEDILTYKKTLTSTKAFNQSLVKINNQRTILKHILVNGPTSRADLAKTLSSTKPTVSTNVSYLLEKSILIEKGITLSSVGKKARLLHFNKNLKYNVICDFITEATASKAIFYICNLKEEIISKKSFQIALDFSLKNLTKIVHVDLLDFLENENLPIDSIGKIVIAAPAIVKENSFLLTKNHSIDIDSIIPKNLKDKFILFNDIKLATIAEKSLTKSKNFIFIWTGFALNSGLFLNDKLFLGASSAAGEIGYLLAICPFTKERTYLNKFASTHGLLTKIKENKSLFNDSILLDYINSNILTFEKVIDAVKENDLPTINFIKLIAEEFAKILFNLVITLNVEEIILAGDFVKLGDVFLNPIKKTLSSLPFITIHLKISSMDNPILKGGAKLASEQIISNLI